MQYLIFVFFAAIFFIWKLFLKSSGKIIDIATDAYKAVDGKYANPCKSTKAAYCIHCGAMLDNNSKFCIACGKQVEQEVKRTTVNPLKNTVFGHAIQLMAYTAKADGVVSANEAEAISSLLNIIANKDASMRVVMKELFDEAKNEAIKDHITITQKMYDLASKEFSYSDRNEFCKFFINWLAVMVYADGTRNEKQGIVAKEIADVINMGYYLKEQYAAFENHSSNADTFSSSSIEDSYKILKCTDGSSDEEVKKAYRDLAKQYHPDTISSKELAEDFVLFANQKFKEINSAYEAVKKHRGMR